MSALVWNEIGERVFETGVEQGVLYPEGQAGVAWSGLISVTEKATGGEPTPYYADGIKYLNVAADTEFEATIEAFTYPDEFEECDGSSRIAEGLFVSQQSRKSFGLSYRTKVGNDVYGNDFGYKIHLVYKAMVSPSERAYSTMNDSPEALTFSWDLTTTPVEIPGFKPSASMTIDSRKASAFALGILEDILYGRYADARLPSPDEIVAMPWSTRLVAITSNSSVPKEAQPGDMILSIPDNTVYMYGMDGGNTRDVAVVATSDELNALPTTLYRDDLVYDQSTGMLYKIGA